MVSLKGYLFASSLKHMAVFLGLQIFIILLKDKKLSVFHFLNTWIFLFCDAQRHFLTLLSTILPLFCVWEVDSKHGIFNGVNFGTF